MDPRNCGLGFWWRRRTWQYRVEVS